MPWKRAFSISISRRLSCLLPANLCGSARMRRRSSSFSWMASSRSCVASGAAPSPEPWKTKQHGWAQQWHTLASQSESMAQPSPAMAPRGPVTARVGQIQPRSKLSSGGKWRNSSFLTTCLCCFPLPGLSASVPAASDIYSHFPQPPSVTAQPSSGNSFPTPTAPPSFSFH